MAGITTWLYDVNSRLIATIDPLALRTSYAYDAAGNRITESVGQISTSVFDLGNRLRADRSSRQSYELFI